MAIRIGIGGWTYEPWRDGVFFPADLPQKSELEYASRRLGSIEINGTYYGSQKPESFQRWHDDTPDDFVFAVKGPRFATNRRVLGEARESIERLFNSGVTRLGSKLGPINWQFTQWKKFEADDFGAFIELLPREVDGIAIRHAVEVRHESFRTPEFVKLARERDIAVIIDGDADYPVIADVTSSYVYARIMGSVEGLRYGYDAASLAAWVERARQWAAGKTPADLETLGPAPKVAPRDVFLYVISGHKAVNPVVAMTLMAKLGLGAEPPAMAAAVGGNASGKVEAAAKGGTAAKRGARAKSVSGSKTAAVSKPAAARKKSVAKAVGKARKTAAR